MNRQLASLELIVGKVASCVNHPALRSSLARIPCDFFPFDLVLAVRSASNYFRKLSCPSWLIRSTNILVTQLVLAHMEETFYPR